MSNLIRFNSFVVKEDKGVVIDSNQKILEKLNKIKSDLRMVNVGGSKEADTDGFISGLTAEVVEELVEPDKEDNYEAVSMQAQSIIDEANAEAERIIAQAQAQAEAVLAAAREEGYKAGIKEGNDEVRSNISELETEYSDRRRELEEEYEKKFSKMEPMLVDTLLKVFSKVTHTMAEDKKDMILCLINSVMRNTDISREFYIRVSPLDYKFVMNNQGRIESAVAKDAHVEIAEDTSLGRNECIIETDAGVFDCSLDIQLENLIKDIRLLSCLGD